MKIEREDDPAATVGTYRTGRLHITWDDLVQVIGFPPNGQPSADGKVWDEWVFRIDGKLFHIHDWKGSHLEDEYSTYGEHGIFRSLFGCRYYAEDDLGKEMKFTSRES